MKALSQGLKPHGLRIMGAFHTSLEDHVPPHIKTLVLIGPDNRFFWDQFSYSAEARDGRPHPIDRWSKRIIDDLAEGMDALAAYPFGGPPYTPFLHWARKARGIWSSPIGPLVADEVGLWVSFRGALLFKERLPLPAPADQPCDTCTAPCKTACPVNAFTQAGYDVDTCRAYLHTDAGIECMQHGCKARRACPIGQAFAPQPPQAIHHMRAFRAE